MSTRLNPQQEEAVRHGEGPLIIVAGAGSGKTKTLTNRLLHLISSGVPPQAIIAITFTNKAADEMVRRMAAATHTHDQTGTERPRHGTMSPFIGTFHSFGARMLREHARTLGRTPLFTIFDNDDTLRLIKMVLAELDISRDVIAPPLAASIIGKSKNELSPIADVASQKMRAVFSRYEEKLQENNAFDFDDLIQKVVRLFESHPEILTRYQSSIQHILVDEFQDVNPAQYALVKLLAAKHRNLSVVGDDAQSIYGFRGSDFRNFLYFDRDWPNAKVVLLEQNYRSTKTIIAAASALIERNAVQKPKKLWTDNEEGSALRVVGTRDPDHEAEWIAEQIIERRMRNNSADGQNERGAGETRGEDIPSIAVIYRTNAQSRAIEQALIAMHVPYRIFGGIRFYDRQEVKDMIAALRIAINPQDEVSVARLLKAIPKKVRGDLVETLPRLGAELAPAELIRSIVEMTDYAGFLKRKFPNADERIENIKELIAFAGQFSKTHELIERIALIQSTDSPSGKGNRSASDPRAVNLMTIHLAKGLEFDHVFIAGADEGTLPHHRSWSSPQELEEERRLMYVAMTRARSDLAITFSRVPSRFLYELPSELTKFMNLKDNDGRDELPDEEEMYIE